MQMMEGENIVQPKLIGSKMKTKEKAMKSKSCISSIYIWNEIITSTPSEVAAETEE